MSEAYQIYFAETALKLLREIKDTRIQRSMISRVEELPKSPELMGKALLGEFEGLRSIRAVGGRYRIIYEVNNAERIISIVAIGIRKEGDKKDIYSILAKLIKSNLLDEETLGIP